MARWSGLPSCASSRPSTLSVVDNVVIGEVAMNLHGIARATEDVAIFIAPNEENVARLRSALHAVQDDETIEEISAAD